MRCLGLGLGRLEAFAPLAIAPIANFLLTLIGRAGTQLSSHMVVWLSSTSASLWTSTVWQAVGG